MYAIYGNMDPINIPPMLAYIPYMDPMGTMLTLDLDGFVVFLPNFYELSMGFSSAKKRRLCPISED